MPNFSDLIEELKKEKSREGGKEVSLSSFILSEDGRDRIDLNIVPNYLKKYFSNGEINSQGMARLDAENNGDVSAFKDKFPLIIPQKWNRDAFYKNRQPLEEWNEFYKNKKMLKKDNSIFLDNEIKDNEIENNVEKPLPEVRVTKNLGIPYEPPKSHPTHVFVTNRDDLSGKWYPIGDKFSDHAKDLGNTTQRLLSQDFKSDHFTPEMHNANIENLTYKTDEELRNKNAMYGLSTGGTRRHLMDRLDMANGSQNIELNNLMAANAQKSADGEIPEPVEDKKLFSFKPVQKVDGFELVDPPMAENVSNVLPNNAPQGVAVNSLNGQQVVAGQNSNNIGSRASQVNQIQPNQISEIPEPLINNQPEQQQAVDLQDQNSTGSQFNNFTNSVASFAGRTMPVIGLGMLAGNALYSGLKFLDNKFSKEKKKDSTEGMA